jgi:hypothetical protein
MLDDVAEARSDLESILDLAWRCPRLGNVRCVLVGHDPGELLGILDSGADEVAVRRQKDVALVDMVIDEVSDERIFPDAVAVEEGAIDGVAGGLGGVDVAEHDLASFGLDA